MRIKLLALDLDGTLLDSQKRMPDDFLPWVRSHTNIKTVISSGRQYYTILRDFPIGRDNLTIVAENGGLVFDNNELIYINSMKPEEVIASLDKVLKIQGAVPIVCGLESAYIPNVSEEVFSQCGIYYARIKQVDNLYDYAISDQILKIAIFFVDNSAENHILDLANLEGNITATLSGERWIDIANSDVNKGTAIKKLMEIFSIDKSEAAAFGDYLNDYTMLEAVDESYCMENGHPELKRIAKYIAPSNDDNGVMKVLNDFNFS